MRPPCCPGAGAQGEVYAAWWRQRPVAVKKFTYAADGLHEVQMHLCVGQHPNIVELRALAQQGSALYMVMEYFPRGTLEVKGWADESSCCPIGQNKAQCCAWLFYIYLRHADCVVLSRWS